MIHVPDGALRAYHGPTLAPSFRERITATFRAATVAARAGADRARPRGTKIALSRSRRTSARTRVMPWRRCNNAPPIPNRPHGQGGRYGFESCFEADPAGRWCVALLGGCSALPPAARCPASSARYSACSVSPPSIEPMRRAWKRLVKRWAIRALCASRRRWPTSLPLWLALSKSPDAAPGSTLAFPISPQPRAADRVQGAHRGRHALSPRGARDDAPTAEMDPSHSPPIPRGECGHYPGHGPY
jgi:hypothetical protein